jgi:hypothetical protein
MAKTEVEPNVPRETPDAQPGTPDVPRETSGKFQPGHEKKGGRQRQNRAPDVGEDAGASFWDNLAPITPEEWRQGYSLYLYRCEPITDKRITGKEIFIKKIFQTTDPQLIMEEEGSGKYLAILNFMDPATRQGRAVYSHYFEIMNLKFPPQVPMGEWVDDPRNKKWAWAKPLLEAEQKRRVLDAQGMGGVTGMDQATQMFQAAVAAVKTLRPDQSPEEQHSLAGQVIASMEKNADRMVEMITAASNPSQFLGLVDKILGMGKGDSGVLQLVTSQIESLNARLLEEQRYSRTLLEKILTPPPAEPRRSLKEELGDVKEIAGMFRGNSAASSGTDWAGVLVPVVQKLLEVGGAVAQVAIARAGQKPPPRPPVTVQADHSLPEPAAPDPQPQQMNPNFTPEQQAMFMELELINATMGPMLDIATPHMVDMFHKATGMHFRDWFLDEYGDFSYRETKKLGPEKVLALFELRKQVAAPNVQQLLQQLQPPEKVQAFVLQFLSDEPAEEEDEDPEQPGTEDERKAVTKDF